MTSTYRKDVLPQGTRVVTSTNPEATSAAIGFWVDVGSRCEPHSVSGMSHFIEHVLFKGTHRRSAFDIAYSMESLGGSLDALTGRETTVFLSRCLPEYLDVSVDIITDMLSDPKLADDDIATEKRVVIEEIKSFEDLPDEIVHELLAKSVWNNDTIGRPILGDVESVSSFSRKSVRSFFETYYAPRSTVVAATGKLDHDALVERVSTVLNMPGVEVPANHETYVSEIPRFHHEERDSVQCYICLGTLAPSYLEDRRYATMLLSTILGGGMSSRLFQVVREQQGLAYSVSTSCEFYRDTGLFTAFLAVDPETKVRAIESVVSEFKRLKTQGLEKGELDSAKRQIRGGLILGLESLTARMSRLARLELYTGDYHTIDVSIENTLAVTEEDIMEEAGKLLEASRFSLVTVGPSSEGPVGESVLDF
jgi:predicted Zn-dependent peptidase